MKIEKHPRGNVLILDSSDNVIAVLSAFSSISMMDLVNISITNGVLEFMISENEVTHLKSGTEFIEFDGSLYDLMKELADNFFYPNVTEVDAVDIL